MPKLILGFTGLIASGKDASKKYLEQKYGAKSFRFSTILRDVLNRLDLPTNRDNMINVSTALRETFGQDLLAKVMAKDTAATKEDIVVVDGVRRLSDIKYLNEIPEFILISIEADPKIRYERMLARDENEGDAKKTFADFNADHEKETEKTIPEVMAAAKYHLNNNGKLEELYAQIDKIIIELKK
jgi:dephospho-CoA kinase